MKWNRSFRIRALLMLGFVLWIVGFKTLHVLNAEDHHHGHHHCTHHHHEEESQDEDNCHICDWVFPMFERPAPVEWTLAMDVAETGSLFGYVSPSGIDATDLLRNKAPPAKA